jgi:hypothetical protein
MGTKKPDWTAPASKWAITEGAHAASIDRIIREIATTSQGNKLVQNVNRDRLAGELIDAWHKWAWYSAYHYDGAKVNIRRRADRFRVFAKGAMHFKNQLLNEVVQEAFIKVSPNSDLVRAEVIARRWLGVFPKPSDLETFLGTLDRVIGTANDLTQTYDELRGKDRWNRLPRSPKEWFVGAILAPIFKRCFGRKAAAAGSEGKDENIKYSPFSRFAIAVMREMGEEISTATVGHALRPPRRKLKQIQYPSDW